MSTLTEAPPVIICATCGHQVRRSTYDPTVLQHDPSTEQRSMYPPHRVVQSR